MGERGSARVDRARGLPAPRTPLVGRSHEIALVRAHLVHPETRLLTLTGPGGAGKTRLALAVASVVLDEFVDGVWFVDLSALRGAALVVPTIMHVLGLSETPGRRPLVTLIDDLRHKHVLLVLDNCEQVLEAAADVASLLDDCLEVTVLATSRAPLRLYGEQEIEVPPLALPDLWAHVDVERMVQYEAVALFIQRAQAVRPGFRLTSSNAPAVAELCVRLDGLPLAIELAAASTKVLPAEALLARLGARLNMLTRGARNAPARHQTVRATLDWSHDLLSEGERILFHRLAVFVGGWTLEAAEAVCPSDDDREILDNLASLVDKSLLRAEAEPDGTSRFRMLETIREYAAERLEQSGEAEELRRRHAQHYLTLAEAGHPELLGPQQVAWLHRLAQEHDNLRVAMGWAIAGGHQDISCRLGAGLWRFWGLRHVGEGRKWLAVMLNQPGQADTPLRAQLLRGAGFLALLAGSFEESRVLDEEALRIFREVGDAREMSRSLVFLADSTSDLGDQDRAMGFCQEALELPATLGDSGNLSLALGTMGKILVRHGQPGRAVEYFNRGRELDRHAGHTQGIAAHSVWLAHAARAQADHAQATVLYTETLALFRQVGDLGGFACCLEGLALIAAAHDRPDRAARLIGAATGILDAAGRVVPPADKAQGLELVAAVRARLGDEMFTSAAAGGRALSVGEVYDYVVTEARSPTQVPSRDGGALAGLTRREREVAALLASGLSDRDVAEQLVITEGTVGVHAEHIFRKLGVRSRMQLAALLNEAGHHSGASYPQRYDERQTN